MNAIVSVVSHILFLNYSNFKMSSLFEWVYLQGLG